jgi:hypothetical protein
VRFDTRISEVIGRTGVPSLLERGGYSIVSAPVKPNAATMRLGRRRQTSNYRLKSK